MLENILMPREYGYKPNSYEVDILDDDVMDALPPPQQDKYIEKQIKPQIEEQLKDIEFDNEADKSKAYKQAVSTKTAKEFGTKHANKLIEYDPKYNGNEYYKNNYITRLQEIIKQDTIKTRSGTKTITADNKERARELLKKIGIKPVIEVAAPTPVAAAPPPEAPKSKPPPTIATAAPPPQPQLPAPPVNFNFDGSFGRMLENMMPRQYGYKPNSYDVDILDDDIIDALPPQQQDKYIEKQIKPQIEEQMKEIEFDNEDDKIKISKEVVNIKASKALGTRHANKLQEYDSRYDGNDYYKQNYIYRLQEIINQDPMKTRFGMKNFSIQNKQKAKDLLEIIGVIKEIPKEKMTLTEEVKEIPKEKMALTEEEKLEKIYDEDLKKYKEHYISKNKKYESYSKAQKEKFNKDLEEIFKKGFVYTSIINQSLQDKKKR